jgi:hypothetical protein
VRGEGGVAYRVLAVADGLVDVEVVHGGGAGGGGGAPPSRRRRGLGFANRDGGRDKGGGEERRGASASARVGGISN